GRDDQHCQQKRERDRRRVGVDHAHVQQRNGGHHGHANCAPKQARSQSHVRDCTVPLASRKLGEYSGGTSAPFRAFSTKLRTQMKMITCRSVLNSGWKKSRRRRNRVFSRCSSATLPASAKPTAC